MLYLPKHRMPEGSFIRSFMEHCEGMETAREYDFWSAVWALGSAVGRDIVIARPNAPVYLNWYVILTADSGITRKSTSVNLADKVLGLSNCADDALHIQGQTNTSRFLQLMNDQSLNVGGCRVIINVSELVRFLGKGSGNLGLPGVLTDLYDCPRVQRFGGSLKAEATTLLNVFVTMLSASTPAWLVRSINPNVIEGGFTSRTMFVIGQRRKTTVAWGDNPDKSATDRLGTLLRETVERAREATDGHGITINEKALSRFRGWYSRLKQPHDSFRESFFSRQDAHVLRLAGTLCINDQTFVIQKRHIEAAIKIIDNVRETSAALFDGTTAPTDVVSGLRRMQEVLLDYGTNGVTTNVLYAAVRSRMKSTAFHFALAIMHELELVQKFEVKQTGGRPKTVWRATQGLTKVAALDHVIARLDAG